MDEVELVPLQESAESPGRAGDAKGVRHDLPRPQATQAQPGSLSVRVGGDRVVLEDADASLDERRHRLARVAIEEDTGLVAGRVQVLDEREETQRSPAEVRAVMYVEDASHA